MTTKKILAMLNIRNTTLATMQDAESMLRNEAAELRPDILRNPKNVVFPAIGVWSCKESPIGVCIYDSLKDIAWDTCLFCSLPNERK